MKSQDPSSKSQPLPTAKSQRGRNKLSERGWELGVGSSLGLGFGSGWDLELGIWDLTKTMSETSVSQESIYRARPIVRFAGEEDIRTSELILVDAHGGERRRHEHAGAAALERGEHHRRRRGAGLRRQLQTEARRLDRGLCRRRGATARDLPRPCHRHRSGLQDGIAARAHRARRGRARARADGPPQQDLRGHGAGRRGQGDRRRSFAAARDRRARLPHRHLGADQRKRPGVPAAPARALRRRRAGRRRGAARLTARRTSAAAGSSWPSTASWRARG